MSGFHDIVIAVDEDRCIDVYCGSCEDCPTLIESRVAVSLDALLGAVAKHKETAA